MKSVVALLGQAAIVQTGGVPDKKQGVYH